MILVNARPSSLTEVTGCLEDSISSRAAASRSEIGPVGLEDPAAAAALAIDMPPGAAGALGSAGLGPAAAAAAVVALPSDIFAVS